MEMTESLKRKLTMLPPDILERANERIANAKHAIPDRLNEPEFAAYVDKVREGLLKVGYTPEEAEEEIKSDDNMLYGSYKDKEPVSEVVYWISL